MKHAAESQLDDASSSCEWWGVGCGALVVAAVIAELFVDWLAPPYKIFLRESAVTSAAIALGIVGEVLFGMRNNRIQTELRKRSNDRVAEAQDAAAIAMMQSVAANAESADAITRAAKLEKEAAEARERTAEIERLTVWRHLSEEQWIALRRGIEGVANSLDVLIEFESGDAEAYMFSRELVGVFIAAGVPIVRVRHGPNSWRSTVFGLMARALPPTDEQSIKRVFFDAQLTIAWIDVPVRAPEYLPRSSTSPNLYIFVAPKPPPATIKAPKRE